MPDDNEQALLSIKEAAAFLKLKPRTVYSYYPDILQGCKCGNSIRIYKQSVESFIMQGNNKRRRR
jgi:hypothetical protein